MTRRIIVATVLLGTVLGAGGTALAGQNDGRHGICIGMTSDPNQPNRDAFCVDVFPYAGDGTSR